MRVAKFARLRRHASRHVRYRPKREISQRKGGAIRRDGPIKVYVDGYLRGYVYNGWLIVPGMANLGEWRAYPNNVECRDLRWQGERRER